MSIVRWCKQSDGKVSDVYIYYDVSGGISCHSALDDNKDFNVETPEEVIKKLKEEFQDHHIPEFVFNLRSYGET